jgi:lipid II:glycine glycyltransferase (peptidoglycan interpeptide bridge formation enzyme)
VGGDPSAPPAVLAARQIAVAEGLGAEGIDVVAADPEVLAADDAFSAQIAAAGFRPIEEIQPSRHRVSLPFDPGADEAAVFEAIAKSTRQRIRAADRDGIIVVRHDGRTSDDGAGEGFSQPAEPIAVALDRFYDLLLETGERRQFSFGPRASFVGWWRAAFGAGQLLYLEAQAAQGSGKVPAAEEPLAGLVLYRHGGRLSTVHSGDHAATRAEHPGALHLLRWRAIQLAIREGCAEMDLGGVDVRGARDEPREGDPLYGLYQHKRSFGGRWVALTGAHERVFDPRGYALGRLAGRMARLVRR